MADDKAYETTSLWKRTLAPQQDDTFQSSRARLRSAYESLRRNAIFLTAQIQKEHPSLTLHDVNHLDALWTVADLIAGSKYELTPTEVFVLGGAILLHDAGHSISTIKGGIAELKKTPEWRDIATQILTDAGNADISEADLNDPPAQHVGSILFAVLRSIHSRVAESLALEQFTNLANGHSFFLLEDNDLRNSYGSLIGLIAASHNWHYEELQQRLQKRVGAIGGLPSEWHIDPVKVACLLRCADAAQIDQRRAPDFLYALLNVHGVSDTHWRAQNKLAQPVRDPDDQSALLFSSTGPYMERDADAWWVAWDLISVVNNELQATASLLRDTNRPPFQIQRVRDADSPSRLANHITTSGWMPVRANVSVSDPLRVAAILGGRELYGEAPLVPLRELIQNAADSVRARKAYDKHSVGYTGSINIRLRIEQSAQGDETWIDVEDDGIGMSERILTGPLLDFGTSLWASLLVEREFPGLRGSRFAAGGRYGIGFFSVFMIADYVQVASKRFDEGLDRGKRLVFKHGLGSRPILLRGLPNQFSSNIQTQVSIRVKPDLAQKLRDSLFQQSIELEDTIEEKPINLTARIGNMAPAVDCDIFVEEPGRPRALAHSRDWHEMDGEAWLRQIAMADLRGDKRLDEILKEAANRLTKITKNGRVVSRAAIALEDYAMSPGAVEVLGIPSVVTHAGLTAASNWDLSFPGPFIGTIEMEPTSAARYARSRSGLTEHKKEIIADKGGLDDWLEQQKKALCAKPRSAIADLPILTHFAQFGIISPEFLVVRRYDFETAPKNLNEVDCVRIKDVNSTVELEWPFLVRSTGEVVFFTYYDREEIEQLRKIMEHLKIGSIFFSPIRFDHHNVITSSGEETFLSRIRMLLTSMGWVVEFCEHEFAPDAPIPPYAAKWLVMRAKKSST